MTEGSWLYEVFNAVLVVVVYLAMASWYDRRQAKRRAALYAKVEQEMRRRLGYPDDEDD